MLFLPEMKDLEDQGGGAEDVHQGVDDVRPEGETSRDGEMGELDPDEEEVHQEGEMDEPGYRVTLLAPI